MEQIREASVDLDRQPDSVKQGSNTIYEAMVTSAEAQGLQSFCGPAPDPVICEHCGANLYYMGFVSQGKSQHIFHWSEQPQRCSCHEAAKRWAEYDAEVERQNKEREEAQERARHKSRVDELLSQSGIRKRFQGRTFDRFITDTPGRKRAYKIARNYAEKFEAARLAGEGLYIEGTNGTGKTHLAAAIGLYLTEREYSVVIKTSYDLLEGIKSAFDDPNRSEHKVMKAYRECDLLIIDDLGKEQCTDWSMSILYSIINERYEAMRPIIITTNFGDEDLIRTLTPMGRGSQKIEAIISRLREVSKTLTMAWEDYRGK